MMIKAVKRVLMAKWKTRMFRFQKRPLYFLWFNLVKNKPLHFVPLYPDSNESISGEMPPPFYNRPTLCGIELEDMNGTTQPSIVSCFKCALRIEKDIQRWAPERKRELITKDNWTHCTGCSHISFDGSVPNGCHCYDSIFDKIKSQLC